MHGCSLYKLNERGEESCSKNTDLREYFLLYLLIYSMETYAKGLRYNLLAWTSEIFADLDMIHLTTARFEVLSTVPAAD